MKCFTTNYVSLAPPLHEKINTDNNHTKSDKLLLLLEANKRLLPLLQWWFQFLIHFEFPKSNLKNVEMKISLAA